MLFCVRTLMTSTHSTQQTPQSLQTDTIGPDTVPSIAFVMSDDQGVVLDMAPPENPMRYLHGSGTILRGLERALDGAPVGARLSLVLSPDDAYGPREGDPQAVPKSLFPPDTPFKVGACLTAKSDDGRPFPLWIVRIDDDQIYVDGNHPLAGKNLHFDVRVIAVRRATQDELRDGRVHQGCALCRS